MKKLFFDFEVFAKDWLVVIIDDENNKTSIHNNVKELKSFVKENKNNIWIGYNCVHYDNWIMSAIIDNRSIDVIKKINDAIISGKSIWEVKKEFDLVELELYTYDVADKVHSLKELEGFMGSDIKESDVDFTLDRKLTDVELEETIKYCTHDVEQLILVFQNNINDYENHIALIETFDLGFENLKKTKGQLVSQILGCKKREFTDGLNLTICDNIKIKKYEKVIKWFESQKNKWYLPAMDIEIANVPHKVGWGGLHGAIEKCKFDNCIILDVNSYYPSLMIEYGFLTRCAMYQDKYKQIYDTRLKLKAEGKKKEQEPYKLVLNTVYGLAKFKGGEAYDELMANNVSMNGQLFLIDLIEKLEPISQLVQSNTDGIIIKLDETIPFADERLDRIVSQWETRTRLKMSKDKIKTIWQKDVNNYVILFENGKIKTKGAFVKELSEVDNNLGCLNKGVVEYLVNGVDPQTYINSITDYREFQRVVKLTSKFDCLEYNNKRLPHKCYRCFASKNITDGTIYKLKKRYDCQNFQIFKFEGIPDRVYIDNDFIVSKKIDSRLDKSWYVKEIKNRLLGFGIDLFNNTLF